MMTRQCNSVPAARRHSLLRRAALWSRWACVGVIAQATACSFDTQTFVNESLAVLFENVATTLIVTALSDLLNVSPTAGF